MFALVSIFKAGLCGADAEKAARVIASKARHRSNICTTTCRTDYGTRACVLCKLSGRAARLPALCASRHLN